MNETDFANVFSACYVSSRRDKDSYFSNYHILDVKDNNKEAAYLQFDLYTTGFFDFSIKQSEDNLIDPKTMKSRAYIKEQQEDVEGREEG